MSTNYVIHPIPLMSLDFPKVLMTYQFNLEGQRVRIASFVWYLEGPRENIIVDAGLTMEMVVLGHNARAIQTLDEGLKKLGLEFGDIDVIIVTHTHHDHIVLARRFPKAKVIIQRAELEFARNPHPFFEATRPMDVTELIEGLHFEVVEGDTKIDDGIELLLSPGHTPGSQSVAVKTAQGTAVITGWCCIQECFALPPEIREKAGLSFMVPGIHTDPIEAYESIVKVKRVADLIIPIHELELVNKATIP